MIYYVDACAWDGDSSKYCIACDEYYIERLVKKKSYIEMLLRGLLHTMQIAQHGDEIRIDLFLLVNILGKNLKIKDINLIYWRKKIQTEWDYKPDVRIRYVERIRNRAKYLLGIYRGLIAFFSPEDFSKTYLRKILFNKRNASLKDGYSGKPITCIFCRKELPMMENLRLVNYNISGILYDHKRGRIRIICEDCKIEVEKCQIN